MRVRASDVIATLDHFGVASAVLLGHSMGGYVAVQAAVRFPDRAERLHLVDAGLPLEVPEGLGPDAIVAAVLGPALERLRLTFGTREEHHDFWRAHPAFAAEPWTSHLEDCFDADLIGTALELRSRVPETAVMADGRDQLSNPDLRRFADLDCPVALLRAPRNLLDEPSPRFPDEVVDATRAQLSRLVDRTVPDVNHYTVLLSQQGADAVAGSILADT